MYKILKSDYGHQWDKKNLVTIIGKRGGYDLLECKCGLKGRSYNLRSIEIPETVNLSRVIECSAFKIEVKEKIEITVCRAYGAVFANLLPGSIHDVIPTPDGESDQNGVWVMGTTEPVKVLLNEFKNVKSTL